MALANKDKPIVTRGKWDATLLNVRAAKLKLKSLEKRLKYLEQLVDTKGFILYLKD